MAGGETPTPQANEYKEQQQKLEGVVGQEQLDQTQVDENYQQEVKDLQNIIDESDKDDKYLKPEEKKQLFEQTRIVLDQHVNSLRTELKDLKQGTRVEYLNTKSQIVEQARQLKENIRSRIEEASDRNFKGVDSMWDVGRKQITDQEFQEMGETNMNEFLSQQSNQTLWNIERIQGLGIDINVPIDIQYVEINGTENLRNDNFKKTGKKAQPGEKYQIDPDSPPEQKWGLEYRVVLNQKGERFKLCVDPKEGNVAIKELKLNSEHEESTEQVAETLQANIKELVDKGVAFAEKGIGVLTDKVKRMNIVNLVQDANLNPDTAKIYIQHKGEKEFTPIDKKTGLNTGKDRVKIYPGDEITFTKPKEIAQQEEISKISEDSESSSDIPPHFSRYERSLNSEMDPSQSVRIYELSSPPSGYTVETSNDPNSFQAFLENYPIGEGDLNYEPKTKKFLRSKMPTNQAMDEMMTQIRKDLFNLAKTEGDWTKDRISKKYLDNQFNNNELVAMVSGWMARRDIRHVNFYKTIFTEGKLNLSTLDNQDCVDSCLRLRVEHLITQGKYEDIQQMGIKITPNMPQQQIAKALIKYFKTTHTAKFARQHHEIGHRLTDDQVERSNLELEVGDFITFNDKDKLGGHTVLVMSKAKNQEGECVYRIATSTLPATEMSLYRGWISKNDILGGNAFTAQLSNLPGARFTSLFYEKGIKSEDHTVSIGNLDMRSRSTQIAARKQKREGEVV